MQFQDIKYIFMVVQPSAPFISRIHLWVLLQNNNKNDFNEDILILMRAWECVQILQVWDT